MSTRVTVKSYMSGDPQLIGHQQTLARAHAMMTEHEIRHLPVLDGGRLVGVVSQRDLYLVETLKDVDPRTVLVEEAMSPDPLTVTADASLATVCDLMTTHHCGSVVVVEKTGTVIGVFTTVDALRALSGLLRGKQPAAPGRARAAPPAPVQRKKSRRRAPAAPGHVES